MARAATSTAPADTTVSSAIEQGMATVKRGARAAATTVKKAATMLAKKAMPKVNALAAKAGMAGAGAKKSRAKKGSGSSSSYSSMISAAISALKERGGSSRTAIRRYIEANHKEIAVSPAFDRALRMAISQRPAHAQPHSFTQRLAVLTTSRPALRAVLWLLQAAV